MNDGFKRLFSILLLLGFLVTPLSAFANESPNVFISEIAWKGSSLSSSDEWIELYNDSEERVDLSGWQIDGAATSGKPFVIPELTFIESQQTLVIANYDKDKSILNRDAEVVSSSVSLSNSKLALTLKDKGGSIIDQAGDGGAPFAGGSLAGGGDGLMSMVRVGRRDGMLSSSWKGSETRFNLDDGVEDFGTPGAHTIDEELVPDEEDPKEPEEVFALEITELYPAPNTGEEEWVEIFNPTNTDVVLSGYRIREGSGKETSLGDHTLSARAYTAVADPNGSLNNGGDSVDLLGPEDSLLDRVVYGLDAESTPAKGESFAKDGDVFRISTTPTPMRANEFEPNHPKPEPEPEPETEPEPEDEEEPNPPEQIFTLRISEVYADTAGSDTQEEFVEIENTGNEPLDMKGIQLLDASGKTFTFKEKVFPAQSLLSLSRAETSIALNNSGETLQLLSPSGDELDYLEVIAENGKSFALGTEGFELTSTPTPGEKNVFDEPESEPEPVIYDRKTIYDVTLDQLADIPDKTTVRVEGYVLIEPGHIGKRGFYIGDGETSIRIYKTNAETFPIKQGQKVMITGKIGETQNGRRIKSSENHEMILLDDKMDFESKEMTLEDISTDAIGSFIKVEGDITQRKGRKITLENENGDTLPLRLYKEPKDAQNIKAGLHIELTGFVHSLKGIPTVYILEREDIEIMGEMEHYKDNCDPDLTGAALTGKDEDMASKNRTAGIISVATLAVMGGFLLRKYSPMAQSYVSKNHSRLAIAQAN